MVAARPGEGVLPSRRRTDGGGIDICPKVDAIRPWSSFLTAVQAKPYIPVLVFVLAWSPHAPVARLTVRERRHDNVKDGARSYFSPRPETYEKARRMKRFTSPRDG